MGYSHSKNYFTVCAWHCVCWLLCCRNWRSIIPTLDQWRPVRGNVMALLAIHAYYQLLVRYSRIGEAMGVGPDGKHYSKLAAWKSVRNTGRNDTYLLTWIRSQPDHLVRSQTWLMGQTNRSSQQHTPPSQSPSNCGDSLHSSLGDNRKAL